MSKCPKCGNKLSSLDVLCPKCGALVEIVQNKNLSSDSGSAAKRQKLSNTQNEESANTPLVKESPVTFSGDLKSFSFVSNNNYKSSDDTKPDINFYGFDNIDNFKDEDKDTDKNVYDKQIEINSPFAKPEKTESPAMPPSENNQTEQDVNSLNLLNSIKNMNLPELDNLDDFDPEEFIRQYRQRKKNAASKFTYDSIAQQDTGAESKPASPLFELEEVEEKKSRTQIMPPVNANVRRESSPPAVDKKSEETTETKSDFKADIKAEKKAQALEIKKRIQEQKKEQREAAREAKAAKKETKPHTVGKIPVFLTVIIWIFAAGVLFGGFYFLDSYVNTTYGGYGSFIYDITDGKIDLNTDDMALQNNLQVSVSQTRDDNGDYAHLFQIDAKGGISLNVKPLNDEYDIQKGFAQMVISDSEIARSLDLVTYENSPVINDFALEVKSKKTSYTYNIEGLELFLVTAKYSRNKPSGDNIIVYEDFFTLDLTVSPDSKVFFNEEDYSGYIDETGALKADIPLEKLGDAKFTIDVIQPGYTAVRDTFTVTYQLPPTKLIPQANYLRVYYDAFECIGSTDPGASVTADLEGISYITEIDNNGRFTAVCNLEKFGLYHLLLTAKSEGKTDSTQTLIIEYVPEVYNFIAEARILTIDEILSDYKNLNEISLCVKGSMKNISKGKEVQNFVLYSQDGEMSCYYYGPLKLTTDRVYTLYGNYDSESSSFYAMYVS